MTTATADWLLTVMAKIDELPGLYEDREHYEGDKVVNLQAIDHAKRLATLLAGAGKPEPHVGATWDGKVVLEWDDSAMHCLSAEIQPNGRIAWGYYREGPPEEKASGNTYNLDDMLTLKYPKP